MGWEDKPRTGKEPGWVRQANPQRMGGWTKNWGTTLLSLTNTTTKQLY